MVRFIEWDGAAKLEQIWAIRVKVHIDFHQALSFHKTIRPPFNTDFAGWKNGFNLQRLKNQYARSFNI